MDERDPGDSAPERDPERYRAIVENAQDPIFLVDVERSGATAEPGFEFRVERLNPAYEAATGLPADEVRGKTPREVMGEAVGAEVEANFRRCVESGEPITYEGGLPTPGGRVVSQTSLAPVVVDGEVTRLVGIARDVTERVQREKQLRRREQQLSRLHDATRDLLGADTPERVATMASEAADDILDFAMNGIHFHDEDAGGLTPVAVSEATREQLGEPPVIESGLAWDAFRRGESRVYGDIREREGVLDPDTPMRSEMYLPLGEYGVLIVSSLDTDAFDEADVELARVLAANTEAAVQRIEGESRLRTREAELERQNERLDAFASVVSHDLRNPLNVAEGRLELVREGCDSEHLDAIERAHSRMEALIDDVLALARENQSVTDTEPVDLSGIVEGCWDHVETSDRTLVAGTDLTIRADRSRLRQLLENLFRNAVEHGGADVTVTVGELPDDAGFYVEDDGPGFPEEGRGRIFDAGYSTTTEGTGFGLSIVEEIATGHGWDVRATDADGGGARVEVAGVGVGP